jgi:hypothetical protein
MLPNVRKTTSGAVGDLRGDGGGRFLSGALTSLKPKIDGYTLPVALIAAEEDASNLGGLDSCAICAASLARRYCSRDPLTSFMTSQAWPTVFNIFPAISPGDDALVPFISQVNGQTNGPFTLYQNPGLIHSPGTRGIGFAGVACWRFQGWQIVS